MSNRLQNTFERLRQKNEGALVTFMTAGDPSVERTVALAVLLAESGADVIELGIPYSDPLADGPVIQASSQRALERGVTPPLVLEMVRQIRERSHVPLVLMTSYNLVLRCGLTQFAADAANAGADGTILTDLPPEEAWDWKVASTAHGLDTVFLVAPTSTPERIRLIAENASGFVYCVSRTGVTGGGTVTADNLAEFLQRIRSQTQKPCCIGFGVSTPEQIAAVVTIADGAVVGSALVDFLYQIEDSPGQDAAVSALVASWKAATRRPRESRLA